MGEADRNMVYIPYAQFPDREMSLVVRLDGENPEFGGIVRDAISSHDAALPLQFNTNYRDLIGIALLPNRAAAGLASVFGILGLVFAAVGLYGVLTFSVAQRSREIGIRMALGAQQSRVRRMVLGNGAKLAGIGLGVGFALALGLTQLVQGMLFGVSPTDPVAFGGIGLLLMGVALLAALIPAFRATRTNPVETLRE